MAHRCDVTRQQIYRWRHELKKKGLWRLDEGTVFLPIDFHVAEIATPEPTPAPAVPRALLLQGGPFGFSLFLSDGRVAIDNNPAERALRPIGIGRKNWLFAGADTGAEILARAMTVIETAKLNGLDPQADLADIRDRIHDHKINRLDELLPWNWAPLNTAPLEAA